MIKQHPLGLVFALATIMVTTSCVKYHEVIKTEFPQGTKEPDQAELIAKFTRSASVYEQFTTQAVFDVLWASDEVITFVAQSEGKRRGRDWMKLRDEKRKALGDGPSFYILADIRSSMNKYLQDKGAVWSVALERSDGSRIGVTSLKNAEVEADFQKLFHGKCTRFKEAYLAKFPVGSVNIREPLRMVISSPDKSLTVVWEHKNPVNLATAQQRLRHEYCDWF